MGHRILVLYAEVMPYTIVVFNALLEHYPETQLAVVHFGDDRKLSKFKVPDDSRIKYYYESDLSYPELRKIYHDFSPDLILCSGRMVPDYLKICLLARKNKVVTVSNSDNHYVGSLRQRIAVAFSYWFYRRYFNYMLVPGQPQKKYCLKLGFKEDQIIFPQYCADVDLFHTAYKDRTESGKEKQGILFLGRLIPKKGLDLLLQAHQNLYLSKKINDELIIIGDGPLKDELDLTVEGVVHYKFMSQQEIIKHMVTAKYFILPSLKEAWGVVIHEAAAAGLPIITTITCGAGTQFVKDSKNGFIIENGNIKSIENSLLKMNDKSNNEILEMGRHSKALSQTISPKMWGDALISCIS